METRIFKDMIAVIRDEQERRALLLKDEEPNFAYDEWLFRDEPFVNELCLMLLVALRHGIERELVHLAARAAGDGKEMSGQQYNQEVQRLREQLRTRGGWKQICDKLNLKSCDQYQKYEALRHLVNSYKHHPSMEPNEDLLNLLELETGVTYAPLPESHSVQEHLAAFIGLGKDATYCDIAERFVDIASSFLADVQRRAKLSPVKRGPVSLHPSDFAR